VKLLDHKLAKAVGKTVTRLGSIAVLLALAVQAPAQGTNSGALFTPDIEYGTSPTGPLLLDVSVPPGKGPFPVAIIIHGGGWGSGDKADGFAKLLAPVLSSDFTWFSINYRLAPTNLWPACFDDVKTALAWVRTNTAHYHGDAQRIALFGYSAGGHMASLAAVTANADACVQAVVGFAPLTDLVGGCERRGEVSLALRNLLDRPALLDDGARAELAKLSPINHLKPGLPPFLLIHGTDDKSVPYSQSTNLQLQLKELRVPCEIITIPGAPHDIRKWQDLSTKMAAQMTVWLSVALSATQTTSR
jgi:alpha-L-fucosidase 2